MISAMQVLPIVAWWAALGLGDPSGHGLLERTVLVMNELAVQMQERGRAGDAERLYRTALVLCAPEEGAPVCRHFARVTNNLGSLYYVEGRYREARPLLERAIFLFRQRTPSLDLASALANMAALNRATARFDSVGPLYDEALAIRTKLSGDGDGRALALLDSLARWCQELGDYGRAESLARRALLVAERVGVAGEELARAQATLAGALRCLGHLQESLDLYTRALKIRERLHGSDHWLVGDTLTGIALVYRLNGHFADAEAPYRRAIESFRRAGKDREMIATMSHLAQVLSASGRWRESGDMHRAASSMALETVGPDQPETAAVLSNYATFLYQRKRYKDAQRVIWQALEIDHRVLPEDHPQIGFHLSRAGLAAAAHGRYEEAESLLLLSSAILERRLGADHVEVGTVASMLGYVKVQTNSLDEAAEHYARAVKIMGTNWGVDDQRLLTTLRRYAAVLRAREDYAAAARLDVQITRIETRAVLSARRN